MQTDMLHGPSLDLPVKSLRVSERSLGRVETTGGFQQHENRNLERALQQLLGDVDLQYSLYKHLSLICLIK